MPLSSLSRVFICSLLKCTRLVESQGLSCPVVKSLCRFVTCDTPWPCITFDYFRRKVNRLDTSQWNVAKEGVFSSHICLVIFILANRFLLISGGAIPENKYVCRLEVSSDRLTPGSIPCPGSVNVTIVPILEPIYSGCYCGSPS